MLQQHHANMADVNGYVDLVWCLEKNNKRIHNTRFLVTSCHNPPYDAVLGKKDGAQFHMLESNDRR
jgi:hypothetical protein